MINEPHRGYIDLHSMHGYNYNTDLHLGPIRTSPLVHIDPYTSISFKSLQHPHSKASSLGAGHSTTVPVWTRSFPTPTSQTSSITITPTSSVWSPTGPTQGRCLWEMHGVWGFDPSQNAGVVLRENYFKRHPETGKEVDWYSDCYYPFLSRWVERVRCVEGYKGRRNWVFIEPIPNELCPGTWTEDRRFDDMVFAPHW